MVAEVIPWAWSPLLHMKTAHALFAGWCGKAEDISSALGTTRMKDAIGRHGVFRNWGGVSDILGKTYRLSGSTTREQNQPDCKQLLYHKDTNKAPVMVVMHSSQKASATRESDYTSKTL
jgi:hypothetical protein